MQLFECQQSTRNRSRWHLVFAEADCRDPPKQLGDWHASCCCERAFDNVLVRLKCPCLFLRTSHPLRSDLLSTCLVRLSFPCCHRLTLWTSELHNETCAMRLRQSPSRQLHSREFANDEDHCNNDGSCDSCDHCDNHWRDQCLNRALDPADNCSYFDRASAFNVFHVHGRVHHHDHDHHSGDNVFNRYCAFNSACPSRGQHRSNRSTAFVALVAVVVWLVRRSRQPKPNPSGPAPTSKYGMLLPRAQAQYDDVKGVQQPPSHYDAPDSPLAF